MSLIVSQDTSAVELQRRLAWFCCTDQWPLVAVVVVAAVAVAVGPVRRGSVRVPTSHLIHRCNITDTAQTANDPASHLTGAHEMVRPRLHSQSTLKN